MSGITAPPDLMAQMRAEIEDFIRKEIQAAMSRIGMQQFVAAHAPPAASQIEQPPQQDEDIAP